MSESAASRSLLTASPYPFGGVSVAVTGGRRRRHSRKHRGGASEPAPVEVKVGGADMLEEEIEGGRRHKRRHSRRHTKKGGRRHKRRHTRKH